MKKEQNTKEQPVEKVEQRKLLPIQKGDKRNYKIVIPEEVEEKIRFLCDKIHKVEWSGTLFYDIAGTFEDDNLVVTCKDIYLMDIGSGTYTEFNMSPDVISYMAQNPELLDCKTGLVHSHCTFSTFFSGTDVSTLQEEGTDRNHFVSLIVNNEGTYTAGITKKIKSVKDVTETFSYSTYGGTPVTQDRKYKETTESILWYELEIDKCEVPTGHTDIVERMEEIKKKKEETRAKTSSFPYFNSPYSSNKHSFNSPLLNNSKTIKKNEDPFQSSFDWDDYDDYEDIYGFNKSFGVDTKKNGFEENEECDYNQKIIERGAKQLVTGNYLLPNEDRVDLKQWVKNMPLLYKKRFGELSNRENKSAFETWAEIMAQYVVENDLDPNYEMMDEEDDEVSAKAFALTLYLEGLEDHPNDYLRIIIDAVSNFIQ